MKLLEEWRAGRSALVSRPPVDYQAVFEQLAERDDRGLLLIDPERLIVAANPTARLMLSYDGEPGRSVSDIVHDPNLAFAVGDAFHDLSPVKYEVYVPNPDRLLRFHLIPVLDDVHTPVLMIASVEDITRLRHLETVRRDFVANVSHELRTPIASIALLTETLQNGARDDPEAGRHFLERIQVETQAMAGLVEELLELSRLESGTLRLEKQSVVVQDALSDVADRLAPLAGEKGVEIRVDLEADLPSVMADPRRIEQVLMNLAHNAIKFTLTGGEVTLRGRRRGRGVEVDVIDTGPGMDEAESARVFERFYKTDKGRNRGEGAGLGLAIARHLVELHDSRLQVVTAAGRGSRFTFILPVSP